MNREEHKKAILEAMRKSGTYKHQYSITVNTLAEILERRDAVQECYERNSKPVITHTNKAGATNLEQNPALRLLNDCNRTALLYLRELGLTPQSLNRINRPEAAAKSPSYLDTVLENLERRAADADSEDAGDIGEAEE